MGKLREILNRLRPGNQANPPGVAPIDFTPSAAQFFGPGLGQQPPHETLLEQNLGVADMATRAIASRLSSLKPLVKYSRRTTDGTTVDEIMAANGMTDPNYIYVGQELIVPGAGGVVQAASAPAASSGGGGATGGSQTYTVASGDTLGAIAANHGTSVDALVAANGLSDPNYLYVGQTLYIA